MKYNNNLINRISEDVENYLLKSHINAVKSRHRAFLMFYFTTYMLNFRIDKRTELEAVEIGYNSYLHFIIGAFKARLLKLKVFYASKLPQDISFSTCWNILNRMEHDLKDRNDWGKLADELESEDMAW